MKICIVSQTFAPQHEGGAEISSRHTARNLALRHEVVVLALGMAGQTEAEPGERPIQEPYRLYRVAFHNSYLPAAKNTATRWLSKAAWHARSALGAVREADLQQFFEAEKFDLIYAHNAVRLQPALYNVANKLGIPVCQHLRDYALLCARAGMYRHGKNCVTPCGICRVLTHRARKASACVKTVISVSDFVRRRYLENGMFPDAKWHVMHNTNTASADFDASLRAARPMPEREFTFGFLGALTHEKGLETLLRAFCALPAALNVRLVLGGRGQQDYVDQMKQLVRSFGAKDRVEWLGQVPPETIFARSEAIVVPSLWHEPQSRVLVESAVYGVPVFAAQTGGSSEIVDGNATGWTFDPANPDALRALMQTAAQDGAAHWRSSFASRFPGLVGFKGTAEDTAYYERLDEVLSAVIAKAKVKKV